MGYVGLINKRLLIQRLHKLNQAGASGNVQRLKFARSGRAALTGSEFIKRTMPLITGPCAPRVSLATLWPLQVMYSRPSFTAPVCRFGSNCYGGIAAFTPAHSPFRDAQLRNVRLLFLTFGPKLSTAPPNAHGIVLYIPRSRSSSDGSNMLHILDI